jgi:two-component system sensor histidine kinase/response regulator
MDKTDRILVIDDEDGIRQGCCRVLRPQGYAVETAGNCKEGLRKIKEEIFDLVLIDVMLPDGKGIDLLKPIRERDPETVSIIITGYATVELAVDTIKKGAYNFISKPFTADMLLMTVNQGLEKRHLSLETKRLQTIEREAVELARARDAAEKLNEFKSSFLQVAAHELRSPVSGAQSLVRTLLHGLAGELKPQQSELLSRVEIRLNYMLDMINDILTLASSKSIEIDRPLEALQVKPVLQRVIDAFAEEAKNQQVVVKFSAPGKSIPVLATEYGLNMVFRNLIGNAIKYSKRGGTVEVAVQMVDEAVKISVADTGIGIPEEDIPHLGDEFFRARNAHLEGITGTGLGLSIVKQYVNRFGGHLDVVSSLGKGTTFKVSLKTK